MQRKHGSRGRVSTLDATTAVGGPPEGTDGTGGSLEPLTIPPRITWAALQARMLRQWQPGEHITVVGPTGSGKTHLALTLAELCKYVLVIATKRDDPLIDDLQGRGYFATANLDRLVWTDNDGPVPEHRHVIYWQRLEGAKGARERQERQAVLVRKALDYAERTRGWTVVLDELMWATRNLHLDRELDSLWFGARTQGVSVIACSQRPTQVPLLALSSASYLFLFRTQDDRDLERLREASTGFPRRMLADQVARLNWHEHEFLFVDTRRMELARVVAPAR